MKMKGKYIVHFFMVLFVSTMLSSCTFFYSKPLLVPLKINLNTAEICEADVPFTASAVIEKPQLHNFFIDFDSFYLSIMDTSCYTFYEIPEIKLITANKDLVNFIEKWLHTRYRKGGSNQSGTDCSGFVNSLYREVYGKKLSRSSYTMINDVVKIQKSELQEGDLVFFKIRKGRISHVGFYLNDSYFIHAARRGGVIISSLDEPYYRRTYYTAGRVKF